MKLSLMKKISRENAVVPGAWSFKAYSWIFKVFTSESPVGNQVGWHCGVELEMM